MQTEDMIPLQQFCTHYHIEQSFVYALKDAGLIEVIYTEQEIYIPENQLNQLEKMVRLNTEMDINLEGIETITHLLQRMHDMQQEIIQLNNRLRMYEND
ncbi:MerR family transcriptional regulator [Panacibacter ginsenosidivorans]|uniref:MerR family transcriptional regulator n=1 Tax=Panacibacter ginsenosidivorans TaxID=1813871 RepID=A0A5B8VEV1_9BACT|nr:chaperone modulator CbpM [Panacibacter ginsenosidivorans]QEC69605.1 MerR family transcriptional regulator [Panacibacter ginsenosidivorans]